VIADPRLEYSCELSQSNISADILHWNTFVPGACGMWVERADVVIRYIVLFMINPCGSIQLNVCGHKY